ncbi:hypothetical protein PybrP1_003564 [[Pythium] brassicae (nom. inval.)]|nr:hypothetical protein PybrP1_003564 [[Pythium] brassicae (nom. inval.)]
MRELHQVTTERDQLRFELEKTKRTLASTERKCEDAMKAREALERLKAHCESLQESLDLSEKIRVRQKKLLQQLQLHQQAQQQQQLLSRLTTPPPLKRETGRAAAAKQTAAAAATRNGALHQHGGSYYDATQGDDLLDALVNRHATADARASRAAGAGALRSGPTAARSQSTANAHPAYTYADFDSLLQQVHSPHPFTVRATPVAFSGAQPPPPTGRLSRPASASATAAAPSRRTRSKSQGPPAARTRDATWGPTPQQQASNAASRAKRSANRFLAPTLASLQPLMHFTDTWECDAEALDWLECAKDRTCHCCHKAAEKLAWCARCHNVRYCSRECQHADWRMRKRLYGKTPELLSS